MESEFDAHLRKWIERLSKEVQMGREQVEELGRRQKAFEGLMERVLAEQAELRREQAELRRRQEAQSQAWQDFGRRWSDYSAAWEAAWETRLEGQMQQLQGFIQRLTALLPPEE